MRRKRLTESEKKRIAELYLDIPSKDIAELIGCSIYAVYNCAHTLGLKKSPEYLAKMQRELGRKLTASGARHRFPKGHTPANKGKKMSPECYQRAQKTMFKKGHLPATTLYDGAETIRIDKKGKPFTFIRLAKGKWAYKHILLWEKLYGKIPPNKILYCKSGDTLDCNPDNWELITRAESMERCRQSDETLAMLIAGRDKDMQRTILESHPELIELKRINNCLKKVCDGSD